MMDILFTIFAYAFMLSLLLGLIGCILFLIQIFIASCKGKSPGLPSWWIFWDATHNGD